MDYLEPISFSAGAFIFTEGARESHFYIIQKGEVQIFTKTKDGGEHIVIARFGPGDSFGEFALLDGQPRSASAIALTNVDLVKVSKDAYEQLLATIPDWASCMLRSFATRLKAMNERLRDLPQFVPPS